MVETSKNFNFLHTLAFSLIFGAFIGSLDAALGLRMNMGLAFVEIVGIALSGIGVYALSCFIVCTLFSRFPLSMGLTAGLLASIVFVESSLFPYLHRMDLEGWVCWILTTVVFLVLMTLGGVLEAVFGWKALLVCFIASFFLFGSTLNKVVTPSVGKDSDSLNLVVITIDGIDSKGFFSGSDISKLPTLLPFSEEAVYFEEAYAPSSHRQAALYALLTAQHPIRTGVDDADQRLRPSDSALSSQLRDLGYDTAAFVGSTSLSADTGFDNGFVRYEDSDPFWSNSIFKLFERLWFSPAERQMRSASTVTQGALNWLEERPVGRVFLWIHYDDLNGPFELNEPPTSDPPAFDLPADWPSDHQAVSNKETLQTGYENAFIRIDDQLRKLFDVLRQQGRYDQTLILVAGATGGYGVDSATPFGSADALNETLLHIPLMLRNPRHVKSGRVSCQTATVSVSDTIMSFLTPQASRHLRMEGVLRGGPCVQEPILSVGRFVNPDGKSYFQERLMLPGSILFRDGESVACLRNGDSDDVPRVVACDGRLSKIWNLMSSKYKGDASAKTLAEEARYLAELGYQ